jgi:hypothetical protein
MADGGSQEATTLRFCRYEEKSTPHRIVHGSGCKAYICLNCEAKDKLHELERE